MTITLPLPSPTLSPNSRKHWRTRYREGQAAKAEAYYLALVALRATRKPWPYPTARLAITFVLKDRRRHDIDNLFASMKNALDGVSQALRVDDSLFEFEPLKRTVDAKNPGVRIEVTE